jgi:hypothetical protein
MIHSERETYDSMVRWESQLARANASPFQVSQHGSSFQDKPVSWVLHSPTAGAHRMKKSLFNKFFFKAFGSKQLFWHLVKVGPDNQDLQELLHVWKSVKSSLVIQPR